MARARGGMSTDRAALVAELRRRAEARRAAGEVDVAWLEARSVEETPATPVDALLRMPRPLLDRASAPPASGRLGGLRKRAARLLAAGRGGWHREQREFEVRLREAITWLAVAAHRSLEVQGALQAEARSPAPMGGGVLRGDPPRPRGPPREPPSGRRPGAHPRAPGHRRGGSRVRRGSPRSTTSTTWRSRTGSAGRRGRARAPAPARRAVPGGRRGGRPRLRAREFLQLLRISGSPAPGWTPPPRWSRSRASGA